MVSDHRGINLIGEVGQLKLFLTIEAQNCTENGLAKILKETIVQLDFITNKNKNLEDEDNYGTEFRLISIIPSCMDDVFWDALGLKERKQIWRKKREADIRLRMNYNRYISETPENQKLLFVDIIIKSIQIVQEFSKSDFRGNELISDILDTLNVTIEQLQNLNQAWDGNK